MPGTRLIEQHNGLNCLLPFTHSNVGFLSLFSPYEVIPWATTGEAGLKLTPSLARSLLWLHWTGKPRVCIGCKWSPPK